MQMKVICAWCQRLLSWKECQHPDCADVQFPVSHGICAECKEKALASIENVFAEETKPH